MQRRIVFGEQNGVVDQPQNVVVEASTGADDPDLDAILVQVGEITPDKAAHEAEQVMDLLSRARPVLGGEAEQGEMRDAKLECGLDRPPDALDTLAMALRAWEPPLPGPASVAIHDDGDVPRGRHLCRRPGKLLYCERHVLSAPILIGLVVRHLAN